MPCPAPYTAKNTYHTHHQKLTPDQRILRHRGVQLWFLRYEFESPWEPFEDPGDYGVVTDESEWLFAHPRVGVLYRNPEH